MKAGLFPLVSRVGGVCRNIERGDFLIEGEEEGRRRFPSVFSCIPETMTLQFGLGVHTSVLGVPRGHIPGTQAHNAGLWWTSVDCAMRFYDHDCGG